YSEVEDGRFFVFLRDIEERKRAEKQIEYMAYYDVLTGLPNRMLLLDRLNQAVAHAHRYRNMLAVCYLDLDGFKPVNDRHGHHVGDELLITVSEYLKAVVREGDTLARIGGDEFVILLTSVTSLPDCEDAVRRILDAIHKPIEVMGHRIHMSASIGITVYPTDNSNADRLLRNADQAMYKAKEAGKSRYWIFDPIRDTYLHTHRQILSEFEAALHNDELVLFYQPRIDLTSGQMISAEALIRWNYPGKGALLPGAFLPSISETPKELELGEWVVKRALDQHMEWRQQGLHVPVSVNISPRQIQLEGFADYLAKLLPQYPDGTANNLELEFLETFSVANTSEVARVMQRCVELGIKFSLDDFGTGYSSLTYFHRLPIHTLKIDQNFVSQMLTDASDLDIVEGVVRLSETLRRPIVAEGVESVEIGLMLLQLGCQYAQGYGIAHPMPAEQLPQWISEWSQTNVWAQLHNERAENGIPIALNVATFAHRRWLKALEQYIRQEPEAECPPLDDDQCQFARWYRGTGKSRYGRRPGFDGLREVHEALHTEAKSLVFLCESGRRGEAEGKLASLRDQSREFTRLIRSLID
ncbi:MAG: EAL domain-containing protein, partial [Candidatus Thiodiazotropha sp. (ex Ctena orbiculata)]|nr:EAL domain-containing protein [Candidatus Thiodiazotropha taylori]